MKIATFTVSQQESDGKETKKKKNLWMTSWEGINDGYNFFKMCFIWAKWFDKVHSKTKSSSYTPKYFINTWMYE